MKKPILAEKSFKDVLVSFAPYVIIAAISLVVVFGFANPAPPSHLVIATGDDEGDYQTYAEQYRELMRKSGVKLELKKTTGSRENLKLLKDPKSGVDVAFVQDGLEAGAAGADLVSLGSLYFEPMWVFYRGKTEVTRFSQLAGKKIVIGEHGGGTPVLATALLKASGVTRDNATLLRLNFEEGEKALLKGDADVAFFLATADDAIIKRLIEEKSVRLMDVDQADAITRHLPYLHHLTLPHGAMDLARNLPEKDTNLVAPTATLVAKDSIHPALVDLLLKAATEVHSEPGVFEAKGEFPIDKDYDFPVSEEAKRFFKTGTPFWQRYLPFWMATLIERFILVALPLLALILPLIKSVPKYLEWRVRSRIYKRYGELKFIETQMKVETDQSKYARHIRELDHIEDRVNHMKVPVEFSEHLYGLREHIEFVRGKLTRTTKASEKAS